MKRKIFVGCAVGGICLWLAFRGIEWDAFVQALKDVNPFPLLLMVLPLIATHYFRSRRWKVLLRPIRKLGLYELFGINAVGFLAIHILPFRLGEFTRPLLFKRRHGISMSTGLAGVAVERVLDGLATAVILAIGLLTAPTADMKGFLLPMGLKTMAFMTFGGFMGLLILFVLMVLHRERGLKLIDLILKLIPETRRRRVRSIADNFIAGLVSLPNLRSLARLSFETVGVWGVMILVYWLGFQAFGMDLPWSAAFTVLGIAAVGVMLPNAPGFVGTYQLFTVAALLIYGVPKAQGFAYATVLLGINFVCILAVGLWFLPRMSGSGIAHFVSEVTSDQASAKG